MRRIRRFKLKKRANRKNFTRTARRIHKKNLRKNVSRGGYALW